MIAAVLHGDEGAGVRGGREAACWGDIPGARIEFGRVGDQSIDFWHRSDCFALDFGGATGDQQPCTGPGLARAADRLAGLAHRFGGHRAAVDDNEVRFVREQCAQAFTLR